MKFKGKLSLVAEGRLSLLAFWLLYWGSIVLAAGFGIGWVATEEGWKPHMWLDLGLSVFLSGFFSTICALTYWGLKNWIFNLWKRLWLAYIVPIIMVEISLLGIFFFSVGAEYVGEYVLFIHTSAIIWIIYYWPCLVVMLVGYWIDWGQMRPKQKLSDVLDDM